MVNKFKIGDWVIANGIGHTKNNDAFPMDVAWRILGFKPDDSDSYYVYPDKSSTSIRGSSTGIANIRYANIDEIPLQYRKKIYNYYY